MTRLDPLRVLPAELCEMVLLELSFWQRITCLRVSKYWNTFLPGISSLWFSLNLIKLRIVHVHPKVIEKFVQMTKFQVREFSANFYRDGSRKDSEHSRHGEQYMHALLPCKRLETLRLEYAPSFVEVLQPVPLFANVSLRYLYIQTFGHESLESLILIIQRFKNLEHLIIGNFRALRSSPDWSIEPFEKLRTLCLWSAEPRQDGLDLHSTFKLNIPAPNLESLCLSAGAEDLLDCSNLGSRYPRLSLLTTSNLEGRMEPLMSIRQLYVVRPFLPLREFLNILACFPNLDAFESQVPDLNTLHKICRHQSNAVSTLRRLRIALNNFSKADIVRLLEEPRLANLQSLSLWAAPDVTDEMVEIMCRRIPLLRSVWLTYAKITGAALRTMGTQLKHLESVTLEPVIKVDPEALEWLRQRIHEVDILI